MLTAGICGSGENFCVLTFLGLSGGRRGGLLTAGICGSEDNFSVDLDGEVDWVITYLMIVMRMRF